MTRAKVANKNKHSGISQHECRAFRALVCDGDTHAEIAFMFECKDATVAHHVNHECTHRTRTVKEEAAEGNKTYSDKELLTAYRETYQKQPYCRMSQACYDNYRDEDMPSSTTIHRRFGSWPNARKIVWGEDNE